MVKVHIIRNENGKVVATYEKSNRGISLEPVLPSNHTTHEVEAEEDYLADIREFYRKHSK